MRLRRLNRFTILFFALMLGALACDSSALIGGGAKPSVVISSPPSGSTYHEGDDVAVQSTATDATGIVKVELVVDGAVVHTDLPPQPQPQFSAVQTWKAIQGTHTILVRATNTANVTSDPIGLSVSVAPSVALAGTPSVTASPQSTTSSSTPTATSTLTSTAGASSTPTNTPNAPAPPPAPSACPGPPVIASFTASPQTINTGDSTTLNWGAVTNATSVSIDQGIGGIAAPGSKSGIKPATTTKYTLTATGCGGPATKDVTVTVNSDWPLVRQGDQSNVVTALQYLLRHYTPSLGVDGIFGPQTRLAVSNFQTGKGLAADGIVGPQTWSALTQGAEIRQGDSGDNVRAAQHLLKTKFSKDVAVDGVFGPKTEAAVKDFQSAHGLVADGIVGPKTWQALVVIQP